MITYYIGRTITVDGITQNLCSNKELILTECKYSYSKVNELVQYY